MNSFIFLMIFVQVGIFFTAAILLASTAWLLMKKRFQKAEAERSSGSISRRIRSRILAR